MRAEAGNAPTSNFVSNAQPQPVQQLPLQARDLQMPVQQNQNVAVAPPPPVSPQKTEDTAAASKRAADAVTAAAETVEVTGAAPAKDKKPAAQPAPTSAVTGGLAGGVVGGVLARPTPVAGVAMKNSAVRWTISPAGRITRSLDGRTWAELPLGEGIVFRALAANGNDVWAGGSGGALFHSTDGGEHWTRVHPSVAGTELNADITRIEFTDPQNGAVLAAAGQTWTTADGGRTWSRSEQ